MAFTWQDNNNIFTVKRGEISTESFRDELQRNFLTGHLKSFEDFQNIIMSPSGNFKLGSSVIFNVSNPIYLHGVGFFGPQASGSLEYDVEVDLTVEEDSLLVERIRRKHIAQGGEIFKVFFKKPVKLEPVEFYQISFKLNGPLTGVLDQSSIATTVKNPNGSNIVFQFKQGSHQMPEMYFSTGNL